MPRGRKPGFHHSEETKAKMSKPKPYTEEHKQNMAAAQKGNRIIKLSDGKRHRVHVNSYEDLRQIAMEKNWWVTEKELRGIWKLLSGEQ